MTLPEGPWLTLSTFVVTVVVPMALVASWLTALQWRDRARETRIARQVAVTEAIHRQLGAIVAPVVTRRLGRGWRAEIAVPLESPTIVGEVVAIARATLGSEMEEVVLRAQEPVVRRTTVRRLQPAAAVPSPAGKKREVSPWSIGTTTPRAS
jgi:hypothetical protein